MSHQVHIYTDGAAKGNPGNKRENFGRLIVKCAFFIVAVSLWQSCKIPHEETTKKPIVNDTLDNTHIIKSDNEEFVLLNAKDCDSDFDLFFEKFKNDTVFQKTHVKFPYMFYYSDEDLPLDMKEEIVWKDDYKAIAFSAPMKTYPHTKSPFTTNFVRNKDSISYIKQSTLNKTMIEYKFTTINGCWYMVEVVDNTD